MSGFNRSGDASTIQGEAVSSTPASVGQALIWSGTEWVPTPIHPAQIFTVGPASCDFTSVKAAVLAAVAGGASISKPYLVEVTPGVYIEDPFTIPAFVSVKGKGKFLSVFLHAQHDDVSFITLESFGELSNVTVRGPSGVDCAAIEYVDASPGTGLINTVAILEGYYGIWVHPSSEGICHAINVAVYNLGFAAMSKFLYVSDHGEVIAQSCAAATGAISEIYSAIGPDAEMKLYGCSGLIAGAINVRGKGGAFVRVVGGSFTDGDKGIYVDADIGPTTIEATGVTITGMTTADIDIDAPDAVVSFSGSADDAKVFDASGNLNAVYSDPTSRGQVVRGELWLGTGVKTALGSWARDTGSTGWVSGGEVVRAGGLTVNVASGVGEVAQVGGIVRVVYSGQNGFTLTANSAFFVYIDVNGAVQKSATEPSRETSIILASGYCDATSVVCLIRHRVSLFHKQEAIHDWMQNTAGPLWLSGLGVTLDSPTAFHVDSGSFTSMILPRTADASASPCVFTRWYQKVGGGWNFEKAVNALEITQYDLNGVLTALAGDWKKDLLIVTVGGDGTEWHVVYGQEKFVDQATAEAGNLPTIPDVLKLGLKTRSFVIHDAVGAAVAPDERATLATRSGSTTASSSHSGLADLDHDDHSWALNLTGNAARNPMTGTIAAAAGTVILPTSAAPAQTAEGSVVWDSAAKALTVGDSTGRKTMVKTDDARLSAATLVNQGTVLRAAQAEVNTGVEATKYVTSETLANTTLAFTPIDHHALHESGQAQEISVAGLIGVLGTKQDADHLQGRDLAATAPTAGQVLAWDAGGATWAPSSSLTGLTGLLGTKQDAAKLQGRDIDVAAPTDTQILAWDDGTSKWKPSSSVMGLTGVLGTKQDSAKLQGRNLAATAPSDGQLLGWSDGGSTWAPTSSVSGLTGVLGTKQDADKLQGRDVISTLPTAGQVLAWDDGASKWAPSSSVDGLTGTLATKQDALKLQGRDIDSGAPTDGQLLAWVAGTSKWTASSSVAGLTGVLGTRQDCDKLRGRTIGAGVPTDGQMLAWNDGASEWQSSSSVAGFSGALTTKQDADKLQGRAIASGAPSDGQFLTWNATGSTWQGTTLARPTWHGVSVSDPLTGSDGDLYFNSALHLLMYYDGAKGKWLSVEEVRFVWGGSGNINTGAYFSSQGVAMSSTSGLYLPRNATIVGFDYSRTDTDAATFEMVESGVAVVGGSVASSAVGGYNLALNANVTAGGVLAVRNQTGGNTVSNARGAVYLRWRV